MFLQVQLWLILDCIHDHVFSLPKYAGFRAVVSAIDKSFDFQSQEADECEYALEALGQIGLSKYATEYFIPSHTSVFGQISLYIELPWSTPWFSRG